MTLARSRRLRSAATQAILAILLLAGVAGFVALGVWQLQRREWKLALIAQVQQRVHAQPTPAPGPAGWPQVNADHDAYRRVRVQGRFLNDKETLVQAVTERGPGFWVLTPLQTRDGFTVLVNRGFVPPEQSQASQRPSGEIGGETTVVGLMRMGEPRSGFLHRNAPAQARWYSRDVQAIAAARGLPSVAPYFIDADAKPNPGGWPVGGLTVIAFPNSHLVYAITWFTLALMLAAVGIYGARETWLGRRNAGDTP
ncbi:MAG: SURF1 family protein [Caulobacteraceae bacterium]